VKHFYACGYPSQRVPRDSMNVHVYSTLNCPMFATNMTEQVIQPETAASRSQSSSRGPTKESQPRVIQQRHYFNAQSPSSKRQLFTSTSNVGTPTSPQVVAALRRLETKLNTLHISAAVATAEAPQSPQATLACVHRMDVGWIRTLQPTTIRVCSCRPDDGCVIGGLCKREELSSQPPLFSNCPQPLTIRT
jgi:hypothetical protein